MNFIIRAASAVNNRIFIEMIKFFHFEMLKISKTQECDYKIQDFAYKIFVVRLAKIITLLLMKLLVLNNRKPSSLKVWNK